MSLVVAVHNQEDIVIAWDGPSRYRDPGTGRLITPPSEFDKVMPINESLALMITGTYASTKLPILIGLVEGASRVAEIDNVFDSLYNAANIMQLGPGEGFRIGLAGYHRGTPTYRLVIRIHGDPNLGYVKDYPFPHYLSGDDAPVEAAESELQGWSNPSELSASEICSRLEGLVSDCISRFPVLLPPPRLLTLQPPAVTR